MDDEKSSGEHVKGALRGAWFGKATFVSKEYKDSVRDFNKKVISKLAKLVNNQEEAILAAKILIGNVEIEYKNISFEEAESNKINDGVYHYHLYPACHNLKNTGYSVAKGIKTDKAMKLLEDTETFKQLIKKRLESR